jgi:hypothetical protein
VDASFNLVDQLPVEAMQVIPLPIPGTVMQFAPTVVRHVFGNVKMFRQGG